MVINHIHTYVRVSAKQWKCADPHCSHFTTAERVKEKASLCAVCKSREIILTRDKMRRAKPRCLECSNSREAIEFRKTRKNLESIGITNEVQPMELPVKE